MIRQVNPETLAEPIGFSHASVGTGTIIALAGQIGWDKSKTLVSDKFPLQFEQALSNLCEALRAAGGQPGDMIQIRIYVTDKQKYLRYKSDIGAAWRKHMGKHFPAAALVQVADLLEPGALVEIEGLAVVAA